VHCKGLGNCDEVVWSIINPATNAPLITATVDLTLILCGRMPEETFPDGRHPGRSSRISVAKNARFRRKKRETARCVGGALAKTVITILAHAGQAESNPSTREVRELESREGTQFGINLLGDPGGTSFGNDG